MRTHARRKSLRRSAAVMLASLTVCCGAVGCAHTRTVVMPPAGPGEIVRMSHGGTNGWWMSDTYLEDVIYQTRGGK